jgi:hypothetical protein
MGLCEFLSTKAECEIVRRKEREGVLRDGGLSAANRTRHQHYLARFHLPYHLLHETGTLQVEIVTDHRSNAAQDERTVVIKRP